MQKENLFLFSFTNVDAPPTPMPSLPKTYTRNAAPCLTAVGWTAETVVGAGRFCNDYGHLGGRQLQEEQLIRPELQVFLASEHGV